MDRVSERNKRTVRLFVELVWNEARLELIDDLIADDYVGRVPCLEIAVQGPQGVRRLVSSRRGAHPDLHVKIEDQIAEDDRVATRWHMTTNAAAARDAGGRYAGISIIRLLAGKQVDSHTEYTKVTGRSTTSGRGCGTADVPDQQRRRESSERDGAAGDEHREDRARADALAEHGVGNGAQQSADRDRAGEAADRDR
jgi:hypothetical protein